MINQVFTKIFGTKSDRDMRRALPLVGRINNLEKEISELSNSQLTAKTAEFKQRYENGESLDELLPETFAVVREVGKRTLKMRHFDVQLIGGMVLHEGKIAEMKTGEGKTLVATLPVYLNHLTGKGTHVVTVNDYLAQRDADWMGKIYKFLGMSVGVIIHAKDDRERKEAYACDVTYGTNNEFGFDYLRDNMKLVVEDMVQREHNFAIVDEVDSILIDEARTPLIISGPAEESTDKYYICNRVIPKLEKGSDFEIDEKHHNASFTEEGILKAEKLMGLENIYDPRHMDIVHNLTQALKAHSLFNRDKDYVVKDGEVLIVDEFTGRLMPGRRYSDGLHQALEAKENLRVERENQTLATITFQNYFRMYDKLSGMTGTADTEAAEFEQIYKLEVVVIPTNKTLRRDELPDLLFQKEDDKFRSAAMEIKKRHEKEISLNGKKVKGQPVLVGTIAIEKSEKLSNLLKKMGIPHEVLNAKHHAREAEIVANAGQAGAVTISTNMAGRGTDIVLGDHVTELGGLHVLGTERHESRRIDNQLRGRSGRQGDPGSSQFYLSFEDDLIRVFGMDRMAPLIARLQLTEGQPVFDPQSMPGIAGRFTKSIEKAQKQVEQQNFGIRKRLLEYDDVMNAQRQAIYGQRLDLLKGGDTEGLMREYIEDTIYELIEIYAPEKADPQDWDTDSMRTAYRDVFALDYLEEGISPDRLNREELHTALLDLAVKRWKEKEKQYSPEIMRDVEKQIILQIIDTQWKDHLYSLDNLREWIGMKAYAQKDPLIEYKMESYGLFEEMQERIKNEALKFIFFAELKLRDEEEMQEKAMKNISFGGSGGKEEDQKLKQVRRKSGKIGRNDPCPCGSGKKYKKCCGK
jgi:preprotein translocase subunit SecA